MANLKRLSGSDRHVGTKSSMYIPDNPAILFGDDQARRLKVHFSKGMGVQLVNAQRTRGPGLGNGPVPKFDQRRGIRVAE